MNDLIVIYLNLFLYSDKIIHMVGIGVGVGVGVGVHRSLLLGFLFQVIKMK